VTIDRQPLALDHDRMLPVVAEVVGVAEAGDARSQHPPAHRQPRLVGHIVDQPSGKAVRYFLAEQMVDHCVLYFRNWLDREQVEKALGYQ
jgi:hypothetical protein